MNLRDESCQSTVRKVKTTLRQVSLDYVEVGRKIKLVRVFSFVFIFYLTRGY